MNRSLFACLLFLLAACETAANPDGSIPGMDGSVRDGGVPGDGALPGTDSGMTTTDGGMTIPTDCDPGTHLCGEDCVADMANEVANGCRLGCGVPCPLAGAICGDDGYCGRSGCVPMTCEELGAECGLVLDNGCGGPRNCGGCSAVPGATCETNSCVCDGDDPREAGARNDTRGTATSLGDFNDGDDTTVTVSNGFLSGPLDSDWYRAQVLDTGTFVDPYVTLTLGGLPPGDDYGLEAYIDCSESNGPVDCVSTTPASYDGFMGCVATGTGGKTLYFEPACEDGIIYIRVFVDTGSIAAGGCMGNYTLTVAVN